MHWAFWPVELYLEYQKQHSSKYDPAPSNTSQVSMDRVVARFLQSGECFTDASFPATHESLYGRSGDGLEDKRWEQLQQLQSVSGWARAGKTLPHSRDDRSLPLALFRGTPSADDIRQGALGDCYFMSALAVVAKQPELLTKVLEGSHLQAGVFQARLCKDGKWQVVLVDDLLPVDARGNIAYASGVSVINIMTECHS